MDGDDPYRSSPRLATCPRCRGELAADGVYQRLACLAGCGEWYPREQPDMAAIWDELDHAPRVTASPWPWSPASCPVCVRAMALAYRGEVRFDRCSQHGVWLDAGEYARFRVI